MRVWFSSKSLTALGAVNLAVFCIPFSVAFPQTGGAKSPSNSLIPPQAPLKWQHSAQDITLGVQAAMEKYTWGLDQIGSLDAKDCTFKSVFLALDQLDAHLATSVGPLTFYRDASPNRELRDAATKADSLLPRPRFKIEALMRIDVFQAQLNAMVNLKASGDLETLLPEERRLAHEMILAGERQGFTLTEEQQIMLRLLRAALSRTISEFNQNHDQTPKTYAFKEEDLEGLPKGLLSHPKDMTSDRMSTIYSGTDIALILEYADNPETRQLVSDGGASRVPANIALLDKALEMRCKIASVLGYETWADYQTETNMIGSAQNVKEFLDGLEAKLRPLGLKERDALLELKRHDCENNGLEFDGHLYDLDYLYYIRKYKQGKLDLDDTLVREYFPVSVVVPAILDIYSTFLNLQFKEIEDVPAWHPDVVTFSIWEKDAKDENDFLGYFYLDLFAREGKYLQNAAVSILCGYERPDGSRQYPVSSLIANFAKADPEIPILLSHSEVGTFFHEMGHVFHHTLARTKSHRLHGWQSVEMDFAEAPSQMLENWVWEPTILKKISCHYETHEALPIEKIVKSRYLNAGLLGLQQIFLAKFDLQIHTELGTRNHTKLYNALLRDVALIDTKTETAGQTTFVHPMNGYDAVYYGYIYSLVLAADMYATIFKADPLSPISGLNYRETVLRPGSSRPSLEMLKDFLGRPPNYQAYLEQIAELT